MAKLTLPPKEAIEKVNTVQSQDYWPDNILTNTLDLAEDLKPLLSKYRETHEPSYRMLANALQNAKFAVEQVDPDKLVKAYEVLKLFRS